MIVILGKSDRKMHMVAGDSLHLCVTYNGKREVLLTKTFNKPVHFNAAIAFCFADDTGRVIANHVCVFFGNDKSLPRELREAYLLWQLPVGKRMRFKKTCPVDLD